MNFGLLLPLGLLALITIPVLILIYIIKPNYQVKHISSTYVWQLSLKYKKKRIPISKLRNILLFLCQLFALTAIALIIARPALVYDRNTDRSDVIAILDSSASMYAGSNGETRFDRAVKSIVSLADETIEEGGAFSVILADGDPRYIASQVDKTSRTALMEQLERLEAEEACSYGVADIEGAIRLSEDILAANPTAKIYLYTDTRYSYIPDTVEVVPVTDASEWNAAILNAEAEFNDGSYMLTVQVACYGSAPTADELELHVEIVGANSSLTSEGEILRFRQKVDCYDGEEVTVVFRHFGDDVYTSADNYIYVDLEALGCDFLSYDSISIAIDEDDSYMEDNSYFLYGGRREVINVLYSSGIPNPFVSSALDVLRNTFSGWWDIRVTEVSRDMDSQNRDPEPFITSGYDLYIYEHDAPEFLPTDGIVFLSDPNRAPSGAGFTLLGSKEYGSTQMNLSAEEDHPLMRAISAADITVSKYSIITTGLEYHELMSCDTDPLLLVRDEGDSKIVLMPFNIHYSNFVMLPSFYTFFYNMVTYFFPETLPGSAFEVGEQVLVSPRGPSVEIFDGNNKSIGTYQREAGAFSFSVPLVFTSPDTYRLLQTSYFNENYVKESKIFVKNPAYESNIWREENSLASPVIAQRPDNSVQELLVWFAAALVILLFAEWFLQSRENK